MTDETVTITERITFLANGGSRHVWMLPNGDVWKEEVFDISPVLFRKPFSIEMETATDRGIAYVERKAQLAIAQQPFVHPAFPYENPRTPAETNSPCRAFKSRVIRLAYGGHGNLRVLVEQEDHTHSG